MSYRYQYINHLTAIEQASRTKPDNTAFKIPFENGWKNISYKQFWNDVQRVGVYWSKMLVEQGVKEREVVGLWMFGKTYSDVIHLFGLQRAGYAPHLMSTYLEDIDLVQTLFSQSNVRVVICDIKLVKGWKQIENTGRVQVIPILTDHEINGVIIAGVSDSVSDFDKLPSLDGDGDDILSIEQSSGSSSGRPKLVQFTRRWMDANAQKCQIDERRTPVFIRSGSFCYVGQILRASPNSLRTFIYADCTVLTPKIIWNTADELANIITTCGVTDIALYPSLINDIIEKAKTSALLTERLKTLRTLTYGGGPIGERAIEWARGAGINIVCRFASTEVGMLMVSQPGGDPHLLQFYRRFDYKFIPIQPGEEDNSKTLYELVILPTSPDCPPLSMRNSTDGYYHTKDLFEPSPTREGYYIFRGRTDDIIIMEEASNCDAKYLEDRIAYLCHDLISTFAVLGQGRPSPALLIEPLDSNSNTTTLHKTLSTRLESLNSSETSIYSHERIKSEYIIILPKGSLPISQMKGTVMRSKAEVKFKELLDKVYAGDSVWSYDEV
ncbi:hypothetical protein Clacol_003341 [Clathrus columnatus]|uniref:AMP-dependent synthetase/ligase domain-containing protein n=1 Tax=Clathrus columnatus TaxID=1419009 RepID=A0AAV5A378_9AGAM|nr:hypothetical protein Clacol_003341 [Clathrus columnatus]